MIVTGCTVSYIVLFGFRSIILDIAPMWINIGDLADSVMPTGEMSATVAEIGIVVLQGNCQNNKLIFPWIVTVYLLEKKFDSRIIQHHFRRDEKYKLSHKNIVSFFSSFFIMFV